MVSKSLQSLTEPKVSVPLRRYVDLLGRYLRPQIGLVLTVAVLLFANIGLQLINPQILRYFIDEAQAGSPLNRLITAAVLFTAVALVQQVTNVVATYTSGKVGWTATNALRADLARHCLFLDMSFHNNHTTGEMIERIDGDANQLGGFFSTFVIQVLGSAILLVGILALLFREDWRAGLVLTGFALLTLFILARLRNVTVAHWKATRQASADTFGFLEERLSGREDIRTSAAKPYVMRRFYEYMRNWFRRELKASFMTSLVLNSTWLSFGVGNAVALGVGAYLFMNDIVTIGTVYLIFHYTVMLAQPIERFTQQLDDLQKATASIVRILELLQTKQTVVDGSGVSFPEGAQSVKFDDVSFSYNQDDTVLHNVDFEIQPGRILGLLGRTGSGKTTMTRLLFRLYDPDEGP
jgi:ATP-binding cassette subfamily B protein